VGRLVPPLIQLVQLVQLLRMSRVQVEQKPKAAKVLFNIMVVWGPLLKQQAGGELRLRSRLQPDGYRSGPDLRALCIKIAAKTLKVGANV
jgi:hypothetical protein